MEIIKLKDNTLRLKHAVEVAKHNIDEREEVQNEQDEAIASLYEELLKLIPQILNTENVREICDSLISECKKTFSDYVDEISKDVTEKIDNAVKEAIPKIVNEIINMPFDEEVSDSNSDTESDSQDNIVIDDDKNIEESLNTSEVDNQDDVEINNDSMDDDIEEVEND